MMAGKSRLDADSKATVAQVVMSLVANTATLAGGMTLGFSAIAAPHLALRLATPQITFFTSCVSLTIPVGGLTAGLAMERWGRRGTLLASCLPACLGWWTMALVPRYSGLLAGRLLTGFATGLCCNPATVFVSEGSTPSLRGLLSNGTNLGFSCGILIVYFLGLIFKEKWEVTAGVCGTVAAAAALCLVRWMPESPVWLAGRGRTGEAVDSLARLRGSEPRSHRVVAEMRDLEDGTRRDPGSDSFTAVLRSLRRPESYKPLVIMNIFFFFQQFCGAFVVIFHGVEMVVQAGVTTDPFVVTVFIGLTNVVFVVVGAWCSKALGRRVCAVLSGAGMSLSLAVLVLYLHLRLPGSDPRTWIPTSALLAYITASTVGFLTLPWAMLGEVFPAAVRGVACGVTSCAAYLMNLVTIATFPALLSRLGNKGVFALYGLVSLLATVFVALYLPETQNKTLAQIHQHFRGEQSKSEPDEKEKLRSERVTSL